MVNAIANAEQITAEWLTSVLYQAGELSQGKVVSLEQKKVGIFNSSIVRLSVQYSADAPMLLPTQFVLKYNLKVPWGMRAGAREVKFYTTVAEDHPDILVRCFAASYDEISGDSYLLLQDLTSTHRPPITREQQFNIVEAVPSQVYIDSTIDVLARFHAYWWERPLLKTEVEQTGEWFQHEAPVASYMQRPPARWLYLIKKVTLDLPIAIQETYDTVIESFPAYWNRYLAPRLQQNNHLTLLHGDTYFCNFLVPREPLTRPTYLLDWQGPEVHFAGGDLVNLLATCWTREQRQSNGRELQALRLYYATLTEHGVTNYSWEDLLTDYKIGLIEWLFVCIQDAWEGSAKKYWWPKMQCLVDAFQDWDCKGMLHQPE
ncbi:oxidoreductase family protein [Tengunoibacter tsumagoiensis]|uniref:CHK kinase-like domain-containing protein n=1 Tax=Tengunoibacter tsumagoiensis TaxID=2014871 RepID=A0A402AAR4_9CHLR|nr:oxidoreductase family protein [Tengunoibacter tsumagoiensis]GCE16136.1 hypothetical protein KTT_59950 [Tengunoibacter tsumagoiensis]